MPNRLDRYMCLETHFLVVLRSLVFLFHLFFVPEDLYMVFTPFIPGKVENMSFGGQSSQYYERRKKSRCDVVASEGSSSDVPLRRSTREDEHRDLPRGICTLTQKLKKSI
jgi:hypothetical protein